MDKKDNLNEFFSLISKAKEEKKQEETEKALYYTGGDLSGFFSFISEKSEKIHVNEDNEKVIDDVIIEPVITVETPVPVQENDLVKIASEHITKTSENYTNFFSQPNVKKVDPSLKSLQSKVKYLEDWLAKVSLTGPGSGEVNFKYLDDVNKSTIGDTDKVLRYNPSDKTFFFGQLSGDQGPIRSLQFDQNGPGITPVPGMISWNNDKDCLDVFQYDNTTLQVGLESYIRVHNHTGNTLPNGTVVQFSGVDPDTNIPICIPMLANTTSVPLQLIGVLTNDLANNVYGRATVFGEVHDVDTTGNTANEIWNVGDLLWVSPTIPGGLTKVRPTAPDSVISVAAVTKKDSNNGVILVRPTIYQRDYYASFYDTTHQTAVANTATSVKLNSTQITSGFHLANGSIIVAENAGLYNYQFSLQVTSSTSSAANMYIWYRKNGNNANNSTSAITLNSNKMNMVPSWNFIETMNAGDTFELVWAVDNPSLHIANNVPLIDGCPSIPSVILTVTQVAL